jgi:DNA-directed RNA polymerase specialized sigma24 family protein
MELDRFRELLKRSSLGTPAAQAHRASIPTGMIERIVSRAEQLERSGSIKRGTCIKPIATSVDPHESVEELARTALSTLLFSGSEPFGRPGAGKSTTLKLMSVRTRERDEDLRRAILNIKLWSLHRQASQRRFRMLLDRLELERRELERLEWAAAAGQVLPTRRRGVSRRLAAILRWPGLLFGFGRDYQALRALTDMDLRGAHFTFGDFCQRTVPPLERAARLLIENHKLEDECVNEVVAEALVQASTRWRWLAEHPAPTTWTVRIALQALDPAIAASRDSHIAWSINYRGHELWQPIVESVWKMPTHQREVIGLWATCGLEPNQIAHVLDLPERRVRQVKDRALRQLQAGDLRCQ